MKGLILLTVTAALPGLTVSGSSAVAQPSVMSGNTEVASTVETVQTATGGERIGQPTDVVISSYQSGASSDSSDAAPAAVPRPDALTGKSRTVEAGMVVPAVQPGRNYAPPKKPSAPPPDTSKDDCMSCAD